jgi:prevent-host-death family protein
MDIAVTNTEAPGKFGELLTRVLAGEQVAITRAGEPIARLGPMPPKLGGFAHWGDAAPETFKPEAEDSAVAG